MPQNVTDNLPCSRDAHRQRWSCLITIGCRTKPQVDCTLPTGTCATGDRGRFDSGVLQDRLGQQYRDSLLCL